MRIKKYIRISVVILIMLISLPAAAEDEITVYVNNKAVEFDTTPFIEQERTLVPIRAITEAMDFDVDWNEYNRTAVISNSAKSVSITIDSNYIDVYDYGNGMNKVVYIDVPAVIKNDRTYIPLRVVSEAFDATVEWFDRSNTIKIEYEAPNNTPVVTEEQKLPVDDNLITGSDTEQEDIFDPEEYVSEVVNLVNKERANVGLPELKEDKRLDAVAQGHSEDMAENNFFDHTNLQGKSPFDRLRDNNIRFMAAGENIAWGHTSPEEVVEGWMESKGHRENILSENFGKIGVGIAESSYNTFYWTQVFTN